MSTSNPFAFSPLIGALLIAPIIVAAAPARVGVPRLDVARTCRASDAQAETRTASGACLRDENGARRELAGLWSKTPRDVRQSCTQEVGIGGSPSYVELLTCIQMNAWSKEEPNPTAPGAVAGSARR